MNIDESRYFASLQRSKVPLSLRTKVFRTAAAGAMLVAPLAACGSSAASVVSQSGTESAASAEAATAATPTTPTTPTIPSATTESAPSATTGQAESTTATPPSAASAAQAQEMVVTFSYQPSSGGQAKRPYVAVWVEDSNGNFVDTISLFYEQGRKGAKWLSDLRQWNSASRAQDTTMSSATRLPGTYTVAWDGTDASGNPVEPGEYVLNIEAAREHGPHSFTSTTFDAGSGSVTVQLPDDGELSGARAVLA